GGADTHDSVEDFLLFGSVGALSPSGRCKPFDSSADGIALSEGVACVALKRLADAERDGDRIYAVIKGVGGGSDGKALGLTAPRPQGQRRALERAYAAAGVSPTEVGLVEAHGTGTVLGDRTELETITAVYTEAGVEPGSVVLGSVKSQIGHTKCAAGLAGLIKVALALHTGVRPPTKWIESPNPAWDAETSPFVFQSAPVPWAAPPVERVAAVSAFGFGGTNFHVLLTGHSGSAVNRHGMGSWPAELLLFRGTDTDAAHRSIERFRRLLDGPWSVADLAKTASAAAQTGPVQVAVVAKDRAELADLLQAAVAGETPRGVHRPSEIGGKLGVLFPGQGSQRPGMLAELFVAFPELHRYAVAAGPEVTAAMFPPSAFDADGIRAQQDRLRDTRMAQPALGVTGLAVDHLLDRLGVRPDGYGGHSYGELVALAAAGAYDAKTLLSLSHARADAILDAAGDDPGSMAAVAAGAAEVEEVLDAAGLRGRAVVANHNAPTQVVISGATDSVDLALTALRDAGLAAKPIPVACAFHSPVIS
ncbi:MAG: acyltransferase domain-containing protein, partial [Thermocrispum sp.]